MIFSYLPQNTKRNMKKMNILCAKFFFPFLGQKVDILAQCAILHPEIFEAKIGRRTCTTPIVRSVMDRPVSNY